MLAGKTVYDTYQQRKHLDTSQIRDARRPGYGGHFAPGSQDNRIQVNVEQLHMTGGADSQRALDGWPADRERRK